MFICFETINFASPQPKAYFGSRKNLSDEVLKQLQTLFSAEDVVKKGLLADIMYMSTANKDEAKSILNPDDWQSSKGQRSFINFFIISDCVSMSSVESMNFQKGICFGCGSGRLP